MLSLKRIKNRRYKKHKIDPVYKIMILVVFVVYSLSVCYAAFTSTGTVKDAGATVKAEKNIRITGVSAVNPVSGAISNYESYTSDSISSGVYLPYANSKITYRVEVTNFGNVEMVIKSLTGLPSNLTYTINQNNYKLNEMICDDIDSTKCTLGAKKTINITISYVNSSSYDSSNTTYPFTLDFEFAIFNKVAKIGSKFYSSLQAALTDVPSSQTDPTTVELLQNTSEETSLASGKNAILDLGGYTLSNPDNVPAMANHGVLTIRNGMITTDAPTNGALNNHNTGTITIDGITIVSTGGRQAFWNNSGVATITGGAHLSSSATERAAVQNVSGGTMTILDCTIKSTGSNGLNNAGTLTIGVQDNNIDRTKPVIISTVEDAIISTKNMNFYNGVVKAKGAKLPFNDISKVTGTETGYGIVYSSEVIDGATYKIGYLGVQRKVTFNPNGGTLNETVRYVEAGEPIGPLPTPTYGSSVFDGWFTSASGGTQINANTVINSNVTYYAHWTFTDTARIGQTTYPSLQAAINAAPNNTQTTIELLQDTSEKLTIGSAKNIIFDFAGRTITNNGKYPIFESSGTVTITNGTIRSTTTQGTINVTGGHFTISGGTISGTQRQAVYITGGTVEITGNAYLTSSCSGYPTGSNMERGTVHNVSGTLYITGGTIISTAQQALSNDSGATTIIGDDDGSVSTTSPVLQGAIYGVKSVGTLEFYDGIIRGVNDSIVGTVSAWDSNSTIHTGTETVGGTTYNTSYLGP